MSAEKRQRHECGPSCFPKDWARFPDKPWMAVDTISKVHCCPQYALEEAVSIYSEEYAAVESPYVRRELCWKERQRIHENFGRTLSAFLIYGCGGVFLLMVILALAFCALTGGRHA